MQIDEIRRRLLATGGAALGVGWLSAQWPLVVQAAEAAAAQAVQGLPLQHLGAEEAADLEAIAGRIVPTTDTPGAREAGVLYFFDQSIGGWMAGVEQMLRPELAGLNATVTERTGAERFHHLDDATQDALLGEIDGGPFFQTLRFMTLAGMFSLPSYGGNRDQLGWQLLGFDSRHLWQPPFGHYDAPFHRTPESTTPAAPGGGAQHGHGGRHHGE